MGQAEQIGQSETSQFDAAFETDGEQRKEARRLMKDARTLQIRTYRPGRKASNEEQDDRFERHAD